MLAVGLLCGIAASILFNVGIALQAIEARAAPPDEGLRVSLLAHLLRRRRWVAGLLLGALGVPLEVVAFASAPFVVVEPILACGLLVLLAVGVKLLGERPSATVIFGVVAIIAGTVLVAWGAPQHDEQHRGPVAVVAVMALLVAASLVPFALRGTRWDNALVPNLGSACGFAATNVAAKLLADDLGDNHYPEAVGWLAVAAFAGVAATVTGMTALQRRPATTVVPISTAVQTFLPVALEPFFLTESWRAAELGGGVLLAGLIILLLGTVLVARTRSVSTLTAGEPAIEPP
jgi:drug/metabolite transporter (DMT)-like permease